MDSKSALCIVIKLVLLTLNENMAVFKTLHNVQMPPMI